MELTLQGGIRKLNERMFILIFCFFLVFFARKWIVTINYDLDCCCILLLCAVAALVLILDLNLCLLHLTLFFERYAEGTSTIISRCKWLFRPLSLWQVLARPPLIFLWLSRLFLGIFDASEMQSPIS